MPVASPLAAATRLHLEGGTEVLGAPIHSPLYPSPVGTHLGTLKAKFARTCADLAALADTQSAHALMRSCLGPAKVQYALLTLPMRHTAAFAADVTATQRATWDTVVGTPTSEGGCGVPTASDVPPVARLAGVMLFLAGAEPLLGCERQLAWSPGCPPALHTGGTVCPRSVPAARARPGAISTAWSSWRQPGPCR